MARLLVIVEGQTEESFVNEVLCPELAEHGFQKVTPKIMGTTRQRLRRGGTRPWPAIKAELLRHLRSDSQVIVTTMVDYYGLPRTGAGAWPTAEPASGSGVERAASAIEAGMAEQIGLAMGESFNTSRFVPFVVVHEFEGLLFSDCRAFASGIGRPELGGRFQLIRDSFPTPEDINDHPETHPSRRIRDLWSRYEKPFHGTLAALAVGIERIRSECPHFRGWLERLEAI